MKESQKTGVLLVKCPDQAGLITTITGFITGNGGNIIESEQHTDRQTNEFFQRLVFEIEGFGLDETTAPQAFSPIASRFSAAAHFHLSPQPLKMAILASESTHCTADLLHLCKTGDITADPVAIISNHRTNEEMASWYKIPFHYLPITDQQQRQHQEAQIRNLLQDLDVDLVVLARYMQILSTEFCEEWAGHAINIHHSFLPAFAGANPYQRAHERGVKMVGATAHYVTSDLDEGPIIAQDVIAVSHRDTLADIKRKGRELETDVLAVAVQAHTEYRVLTSMNRTVVFN